MPPPPPPPPPPVSNLATKPPPKTDDRSKLLADIQHGMKLKKTVTNDRSAPMVGGKTSAASGNSSSSSAPSLPKGDGGNKQSSIGGLGALFANGVPRKPSEAKNQQNNKPVRAATTPIISTNNSNAPIPPSAAAKPSNSSVNSIPINNNNNNTIVNNNNHTVNTSSAPVPPPKLKPTPHSASSLQSSNKSPSPPQQQLAAVLRPTQSPTNDSPVLRKQESKERMIPKQITRPAVAPPPPPPALMKPPSSTVSSPTNFVTTAKVPSTQPIRPAPPAPNNKQKPTTQQAPPSANSTKHPIRDAPPPPVPMRISSYIDSTEHRFHFLPVHELPLPEPFAGFQKRIPKRLLTSNGFNSSFTLIVMYIFARHAFLFANWFIVKQLCLLPGNSVYCLFISAFTFSISNACDAQWRSAFILFLGCLFFVLILELLFQLHFSLIPGSESAINSSSI
ncbi:WH2 domain-containing protein [Aphelenchoides besseyi]|nr:WH2 domain-containing protein [Aphelenchoides besseyi]